MDEIELTLGEVTFKALMRWVTGPFKDMSELPDAPIPAATITNARTIFINGSPVIGSNAQITIPEEGRYQFTTQFHTTGINEDPLWTYQPLAGREVTYVTGTTT